MSFEDKLLDLIDPNKNTGIPTGTATTTSTDSAITSSTSNRPYIHHIILKLIEKQALSQKFQGWRRIVKKAKLSNSDKEEALNLLIELSSTAVTYPLLEKEPINNNFRLLYPAAYYLGLQQMAAPPSHQALATSTASGSFSAVPQITQKHDDHHDGKAMNALLQQYPLHTFLNHHSFTSVKTIRKTLNKALTRSAVTNLMKYCVSNQLVENDLSKGYRLLSSAHNIANTAQHKPGVQPRREEEYKPRDVVVAEEPIPIPSYEQIVASQQQKFEGKVAVESKDLATFMVDACRHGSKSKFSRSAFLANGFEQGNKNFKDSAFLGLINNENDSSNEEESEDFHSVHSGKDSSVADDKDIKAFINTGEPFCLAAIGVQGGGKSHTLNCILESCLIPVPEGNIINLHHPMTAVVLHYDQTITSVCEATGLIRPNPMIPVIATTPNPVCIEMEMNDIVAQIDDIHIKHEHHNGNSDDNEARDSDEEENETSVKRNVASASSPSFSLSSLFQKGRCLPTENLVVLVSPTYYQQRKAFYSGYCTVKPLLFDWRKLSADHIRRLMKLKDSDNQLYVASMFNLLRSYQRLNKIPDYDTFRAEVSKICKLPGQESALTMRLNLLDSIIKQSADNKRQFADIDESLSGELSSECKSGKLVVVDLTDPLLSSDDVNGIFQVLTEQFRSLKDIRGKLLVLDEAHRYMDGMKEDGLSKAIVDVARLMRHDGMRLAISTQSPKVLAPELLELITSVVMHRFHSKDWFDYLSLKLSLPKDLMEDLYQLEPGEAFIFASRNLVDPKRKVFRINVRPRITADRGASIGNFVV